MTPTDPNLNIASTYCYLAAESCRLRKLKQAKSEMEVVMEYLTAALSGPIGDPQLALELRLAWKQARQLAAAVRCQPWDLLGDDYDGEGIEESVPKRRREARRRRRWAIREVLGLAENLAWLENKLCEGADA